MNDYEDQIENDEQLYAIAQLIDNDFFLESIKEQIYAGLDCSTTDYLSKFYIKVEQVRENYQEEDYGQLLQFTTELCSNIIQWIEDKYGIDISYESDMLEKAAKQAYQLFATELKEILVAGIVAYIVEQYQTIIESIGKENLKTSFITADTDAELIDKLIAAGNIGTLIDWISNADISFDEFFTYASRNGDNAILSDIASDNYIISLTDADSVFSTFMQNIRESEYDHSIPLDIYDKVLAQFGLNNKQVTLYGDSFDIEYHNDESDNYQ